MIVRVNVGVLHYHEGKVRKYKVTGKKKRQQTYGSRSGSGCWYWSVRWDLWNLDNIIMIIASMRWQSRREWSWKRNWSCWYEWNNQHKSQRSETCSWGDDWVVHDRTSRLKRKRKVSYTRVLYITMTIERSSGVDISHDHCYLAKYSLKWSQSTSSHGFLNQTNMCSWISHEQCHIGLNASCEKWRPGHLLSHFTLLI